MADRVLRERLQQQGRHQRIVQPGRDVPVHGQAIAQARLFDLQVMPQQAQFFFQRHLVRVAPLQAAAQQLAQAHQHAVGGARIAMDGFRDRIQGVEQEVWIDLRA